MMKKLLVILLIALWGYPTMASQNLSINEFANIETAMSFGDNDTIMSNCPNDFEVVVDGMNVIFLGYVYGEGEATYTWDFGDNTPIEEGASVSHEYLEEGSYFVSLMTVLNDTCEYVSMQVVEVESWNVGNDTTIMNDCPNDFEAVSDGLNVNFSGYVYGEGEATYRWDFGDNSPIGEGAEVAHQYLEMGAYEVTLTTVLNDTCEYVSTQMIAVCDNGPSNDSSYCNNFFEVGIDGLKVDFSGYVEGEGVATYEWDFGDNTAFGEGAVVSHEYSEEGWYFVTLTTVLNDTCESVSTLGVRVWNDSTDCQNDFIWTVNGLELSVEAVAVGDQEIVSYFWDFGDGTTSDEGEAVTHTYAEEGIYEVQLITVDEAECTAVSLAIVVVQATNSNYIIEGTVFVENDLVDYGVVSLYSIVSDTIGGEGDIILLDFTMTEDGEYEFNNLPVGNYLVQAAPVEVSAHYGSALPTYYGDVAHWMDATIVIVSENGAESNPYDIHLISEEGVANGQGQISGDIIGEDVKAVMSNDNELVLHLMDENNQVLSFVYGEINNSFEFSDLAYGTYIVYTEVIGVVTYPSVVVLNADNPNAEIEIFVKSTEVTNSIDEVTNLEVKGSVYPNPVNTFANIRLNLLSSSKVELLIINQLGQVLENRNGDLSQGEHTFTFNIQDYPSGLYFIQIKSDKNIVTQKFIKE